MKRLANVVAVSLAMSLAVQADEPSAAHYDLDSQGGSRDAAATVQHSFDGKTNRHWIGADFWANRLVDWRREGEKAVCITPENMSSLFLLTSELDAGKGYELCIRMGALRKGGELPKRTWLGLDISNAHPNDYKATVIYLTQDRQSG